jgi:hypothetical protein
MRFAFGMLALCASLAFSTTSHAEFFDGYEQEVVTFTLSSLGSSGEEMTAPAGSSEPTRTEAPVDQAAAEHKADLAALSPERFLDPHEAETAALIATEFATSSVEMTGSISAAAPLNVDAAPWRKKDGALAQHPEPNHNGSEMEHLLP